MNLVKLGCRILAAGLFVVGASVFILHPGASGNEPESEDTDVPVSLGKIARMTLRDYLIAYGTVEPEPARDGKPPASAFVAAQMAGLISEARCEEGQKVKRGQVLFSLDHRLVDVQVEKARASVLLAEKNLTRKVSLNKTGNVSQKLLDEARQQRDAAHQDLRLAQTQRALLWVEAPLNGTIVTIHVRPGEAVSSNTVLAELVDLDRLVANVAVPGAELPRIQIGQPATLSDAADPENEGRGTQPLPLGSVSFIGLQVDPRTVSAPVRIALPAGSGLRPGQFVQALITVDERPGRLAVPVESVVTVDGQSAVFVASENQAVRKPVRTGIRDGNFIEVDGEGLQAGMNVVITGAWGLPEKTRIHVIDQ